MRELIAVVILMSVTACAPKLSDAQKEQFNKKMKLKKVSLIKFGEKHTKVVKQSPIEGEVIEELELTQKELQVINGLKGMAGLFTNKQIEVVPFKYKISLAYSSDKEVLSANGKYFLGQKAVDQFITEEIEKQGFNRKCVRRARKMFGGTYCAKYKTTKRENYDEIAIKVKATYEDLVSHNANSVFAEKEYIMSGFTEIHNGKEKTKLGIENIPGAQKELASN